MRTANTKTREIELPSWVNRTDELSQLRRENAEQAQIINELTHEEPQEPLTPTERLGCLIGLIISGAIIFFGVKGLILWTINVFG